MRQGLIEMRASVVIVSKDRKDQLRLAISSAISQTEPVEVLVVDDGSTDGTEEMVRSEFPGVWFTRSITSLGYITQRNRAARLCSGEVIFSIDDDAEFSSPHIVAQTLDAFSHPRVGAIAIPYTEPHKSGEIVQLARDSERIWITDSFRGTAYALRRDLFLSLGGYREHFVHQGEEMDFCIRLLDAGFVVRLGFGDLIHHYEHPKRDWSRVDYYGRRNDILFAMENVPMPYLPMHLMATTVNGMMYSVRCGRPSAMFKGMLAGYAAFFSSRRCTPVSRNTYYLHRLLRKQGPKPLSDIESNLPLKLQHIGL
jgi:glycosyltransferase involved in cell wall biosynthesis